MKKLTATELMQQARGYTKRPGSSSWIDTHPNRVAIIDAVKQGAPPTGIIRALRKAGDSQVTRGKLDTVIQRVREGAL
jgi:hypothetical protein